MDAFEAAQEPPRPHLPTVPGSVVRARLSEREVGLWARAEAAGDDMPWTFLGDSLTWAHDDDLSEVEVLFVPGGGS